VLLTGDSLPDKREQKIIRDATVNFTGLQLLLPNPDIYGDIPLMYYQQVIYKAGDLPTIFDIA
jgi:hypothetical protein